MDSGTTLNYLKEYLQNHDAKCVKICTLLDKPEGRRVDIDVDYIGFTVDDRFIVGYGLDFDQKLSLIHILPDVMVESEIDNMMSEFDQQLRSQGMDLEGYFKYLGTEPKDFRDNLREEALKKVKTCLLYTSRCV